MDIEEAMAEAEKKAMGNARSIEDATYPGGVWSGAAPTYWRDDQELRHDCIRCLTDYTHGVRNMAAEKLIEEAEVLFQYIRNGPSEDADAD